MAQNPYISLDSVLLDFLAEAEYSQHRYFKLWHLAFRGFENLGLDFFYRVKSVKLPINANFTVTLPSDYLNWTKIGILNDNGAIIPLTYNSNMTTYADVWPDRIEKTDDPQSLNLELNWNGNTWCNWWNGSTYSNVFGVPSGEPFVGEFKVDVENGVIILNQNFQRDYLMLEYVSSPVEGQEYYLPVQFMEAVIAWLWWKDSKAIGVRKGRVGVRVGVMRDLKSDFYNERRKAIAQWKPTTLQEKYQSSQQLTRLAVKT